MIFKKERYTKYEEESSPPNVSLTDSAAPTKIVKNIFKGVQDFFGDKADSSNVKDSVLPRNVAGADSTTPSSVSSHGKFELDRALGISKMNSNFAAFKDQLPSPDFGSLAASTWSLTSFDQ